MRTTLDLDDDLLEAAKELAAVRGTTAGRVISDLVRQALESRPRVATRNGVPLLPARPAGSRRPSMAQVNALRDEA
ncbi:CopG family transcriptional regulator [Luteitalea sp.]|uniref:CopG family transcriptional regulator n=1 Tax=Luteitalea sp. TaxID=2004800 RepID=UPI0037CC0205